MAEPRSFISQYGITWTFDGDHETGQFANGDWWVVGPVTITSIDPAPVASVTDGRNGAILNPRYIPSGQPYDARGRNYDAGYCAVPPIHAQPGDSILSSASLDELTGAGEMKSYIRTMTVLTIVDVSQSPDKFRPPVVRPTRVGMSANDNLLFSADDIHWEFLPSPGLQPVADTPPLEDTIRKFQRYRLEQYSALQAAEITPRENASQYGRAVSDAVSAASMQLMLNYTNEEKKPLMVGLIQYGIDLYGVFLDGGNWHADGGIYCGRKWPLLFAGIMLDKDEIKNLNLPPAKFHEDGQTFYVTRHPDGDNAPPGNTDYDIYTPPYPLREYYWSGNTYKNGNVKVIQGSSIVEGTDTNWEEDAKVQRGYGFGVENDVEAYKVDGWPYFIAEVIDNTHVRLTQEYRGETNVTGTATYKIQGIETFRFGVTLYYGHGNGGKLKDYKEYTAEHEGMPEWGIVHDRYPHADGLNWDATYRASGNGASWAGFVLAAIILEEKTQAKTLWDHPALFDYQDRYMMIEYNLGNKGTSLRQRGRFTENMWDEYRDDYSTVCPVWQSANEAQIATYFTPDVIVTEDPGSGSGPQPTTYQLTISISGNGRVTKNPDKAVYNSGESVTIQAIPDSGYIFTSWSGNVEGAENPTIIIMDGDKSITAEFETVSSIDPHAGEEITETKLHMYNNIIKSGQVNNLSIWIDIKKTCHVSVVLYDRKGRKIKTFINEEKSSDRYPVFWDGCDESNNVVGSGIYMLHVKAGEYTETKKIAVIK